MPCKAFARGRIDRLVKSVSGRVSIKHLAKDQLFFLLLLLMLLSLWLFFIPFSPPPPPLGFGDMSTSPSLGDFASQESKAAPGDFAI